MQLFLDYSQKHHFPDKLIISEKWCFQSFIILIPSNYLINDIAASSAIIVTSGWNLKIDPGTSGVTGP